MSVFFRRVLVMILVTIVSFVVYGMIFTVVVRVSVVSMIVPVVTVRLEDTFGSFWPIPFVRITGSEGEEAESKDKSVHSEDVVRGKRSDFNLFFGWGGFCCLTAFGNEGDCF